MPSNKPTAYATEQFFRTPPELPWLELRTSLHSVLPYAPHFHSSLSVGMILEGRTAFGCPHETHIAASGDIVLMEPGLAHSCNPLDNAARSYHMLHVETAWLRLQGLADSEAFSLRRRVVKNPGLFARLCHIADAVQSNDISGRMAVELAEILVALLEGNLVPEQTIKEPELLRRKSALSREAFIRAFRRASGLPPARHSHLKRLEEARRLLKAGVEISEAALASGHSDQSHLHRAFVRYYAATPGQYRKNRSLSYKK